MSTRVRISMRGIHLDTITIKDFVPTGTNDSVPHEVKLYVAKVIRTRGYQYFFVHHENGDYACEVI